MTHQLTGEEIKNLLFGAKTTGIDLFSGRQWWIDRKTNGECTWRGPGPIPFDPGKSRIEGYMICNQFQKRLWKIEICGTVFRNPGGTYESKDEYVICWDTGISPLSVAR